MADIAPIIPIVPGYKPSAPLKYSGSLHTSEYVNPLVHVQRVNSYLAAFNNAENLNEAQRLNEFKNSLIGDAAEWVGEATQLVMDYNTLTLAFVARFTNPLFQTIVESEIRRLKPDLGQEIYTTAIFNLNVKFNKLQSSLVDRTPTYLKDLYLDTLPSTMKNHLIESYGSRYNHNNNITLEQIQERSFTVADAHQHDWVQIKKFIRGKRSGNQRDHTSDIAINNIDNRGGKRSRYDPNNWWNSVARDKLVYAKRCLNCKQPVSDAVTSHHPPRSSWTCQNVRVSNDAELARYLN